MNRYKSFVSLIICTVNNEMKYLKQVIRVAYFNTFLILLVTGPVIQLTLVSKSDRKLSGLYKVLRPM